MQTGTGAAGLALVVAGVLGAAAVAVAQARALPLLRRTGADLGGTDPAERRALRRSVVRREQPAPGREAVAWATAQLMWAGRRQVLGALAVLAVLVGALVIVLGGAGADGLTGGRLVAAVVLAALAAADAVAAAVVAQRALRGHQHLAAVESARARR